MSQKIDTRAIGLDTGVAFVTWLTGSGNLHYGLWDGLDVVAGNLRRAQDAYTEKLFGLLPPGPLRILDIGGGAGVTAAKLIALGHRVEIVVPSAELAARCREAAPEAVVHECLFEDYAGKGPFDLCLFSESFQYIPLDQGLPRCLDLLVPGGAVVIADCFRTEAYQGRAKHGPQPGGGHRLSAFRTTLSDLPFETRHEEDVTESVAPSIDLEQGLFNVFGLALKRVDAELRVKRPRSHWALSRFLTAVIPARRRKALWQRLTEKTRTAEIFCHYNRYLMLVLVRQ